MCPFIVRTLWGIDLTKNPKKRERRKNRQRIEGILRRGDFVGKGGGAVSLGIFSSWGVANVTIVTYDYTLVIEFLFPMNVGVSLCFHCTVLVPVYRV